VGQKKVTKEKPQRKTMQLVLCASDKRSSGLLVTSEDARFTGSQVDTGSLRLALRARTKGDAQQARVDQ